MLLIKYSIRCLNPGARRTTTTSSYSLPRAYTKNTLLELKMNALLGYSHRWITKTTLSTLLQALKSWQILASMERLTGVIDLNRIYSLFEVASMWPQLKDCVCSATGAEGVWFVRFPDESVVVLKAALTVAADHIAYLLAEGAPCFPDTDFEKLYERQN
ncbi:hypothetical protein Pelo_5062 [Pelomyxa schiedti]|nr:hypothetical protein Pelo_5062 [Pelomyxa schiedti]